MGVVCTPEGRKNVGKKHRENPTSVTVEGGKKALPMHMRILRQDFGWEIHFNYDSDGVGKVEVFDAGDKVIDASEVQPGDTVSILLNVADWGLTVDNVRDAIKSIA